MVTTGRASSLLLALLVTACTAEGPDVGSQLQPIYYGEPTEGATYTSVVAVGYGPGDPYFCTGTLITSWVVLTAAHCLAGEVASDIQVFFGDDAVAETGEFRQASELLVHTDWDDVELTGDIALIRLASPAPAAAHPIPFLPTKLGLSDADVGAAVDWSGFGLTEQGTDGIKLHSLGTIELVCAGPETCVDGLAVPKSFYYSMAKGGPCSGDSGGPTFLARDKDTFVVGVTSYGDEECVDYGVNTTVSEYQPWIESFLAAGGVEDCHNDIDDDASGDIDCADPKCAEDEICLAAKDDGGCRVGTSSGRGSLAWVLLGLVLGLRRRRR